MNPKRTFLDKILGRTVVDNSAQHARQDAERAKFLKAIAQNETSVVPEPHKYSSFQDSGVPAYGRALGKYRVTEGELSTYSPIYAGRKITATEFLRDPNVQDQYMRMKYNYYKNQGYTPQQIADIHNRGVKNVPADPNVHQSPDYVKKFELTYNR